MGNVLWKSFADRIGRFPTITNCSSCNRSLRLRIIKKQLRSSSQFKFNSSLSAPRNQRYWYSVGKIRHSNTGTQHGYDARVLPIHVSHSRIVNMIPKEICVKFGINSLKQDLMKSHIPEKKNGIAKQNDLKTFKNSQKVKVFRRFQLDVYQNTRRINQNYFFFESKLFCVHRNK